MRSVRRCRSDIGFPLDDWSRLRGYLSFSTAAWGQGNARDTSPSTILCHPEVASNPPSEHMPKPHRLNLDGTAAMAADRAHARPFLSWNPCRTRKRAGGHLQCVNAQRWGAELARVTWASIVGNKSRSLDGKTAEGLAELKSESKGEYAAEPVGHLQRHHSRTRPDP